MTPTKAKKKNIQKTAPKGLSENVRIAMERYFNDLDGHDPKGLHDLIISQVEKPLFETVLSHTRGNVSHAATVLGVNRGTLRNRLKKYGLE